MKIRLEDSNESGHPAYFADGRQRLATCTSVCMIDRQRLVTGSLVGQALYLIGFDAQRGTHTVLDRVSTVCEGTKVCTDLLDFDGRDLIATSNCEDSSMSFYRLSGDRLAHESDIRVGGQDQGFCHGVAFVPDSDLVCAAIQSGPESFQLWSLSSKTIVARVRDPGWLPKDAAFISRTTMLALYSTSAALKKIKGSHGTKLALIEFSDDFQSHAKRAEWILDTGQVDCVSNSAGHVFLTDQGRDKVRRYRLDDGLHEVGSLDGYDFPHGCDYDHASGLLVVTNYATNSLDIRHVD